MTEQLHPRWWVAREHLRPTRFGEPPTAALLWAVRPALGRGKRRILNGPATYFPTQTQALNYAHRQAQLLYGPRKAR